MSPLEKLIKIRKKEIASIAPKFINTTIIFERPEVSFKIHPSLAGEIYHITDPRLDDEKAWGNPWAFFEVFMENIKNCIASEKTIIVMNYNIFIANEIGSLYLCMDDKLKHPFCLAFYHNGEKLTATELEDFYAPIDVKTTALVSMQYFDFIAKYEIPVGFEITLPFKPEG